MSRKCLTFMYLFPAIAAGSDPQSRETLRVFVTDRSGIPPVLGVAAQLHAARLLEAAGVQTSWKICGPSSLLPGRKPCFQSSPLSVAVRLLPANEAKAWPFERSACGLALPGEAAEHGFLAVIHADCISRIARPASQAWVKALAHVMAHEIGHLLLGKGSHSPAGLMSAEWLNTEFKLLLRGELHFSPDDASALQAAMQQRASAYREFVTSIKSLSAPKSAE